MATLCVIAVVVGMIMAALWWRGDGRRASPRCPRCWYPQATAVPPVTCPECGRTASDARELHRRRRSPAVLAVAAAVCLAGAGGWFYSAATWAWAPTGVLLALSRRLPEGGWLELARRFEQGRLEAGTRRRAVAAASRGLVAGGPVSSNRLKAFIVVQEAQNGDSAARDAVLAGLRAGGPAADALAGAWRGLVSDGTWIVPGWCAVLQSKASGTDAKYFAAHEIGRLYGMGWMDDEVIAALEHALLDRSTVVRATAAASLADSVNGARAARSGLEALLLDEDSLVRYEAKRALESLEENQPP